jgi:hypothetical protein
VINTAITPLGTEMPHNTSTTYPYITYYLRTHFNYSSNSPVDFYNVSALIDDGAVFYLNGHEIKRIRMPEAPTPIDNATRATTTPCAGDATCSDDFTISGAAMAFLQEGDNVLAAEVHNYNGTSHDIVFAASLTAGVPPVVQTAPTIQTHIAGNQLVIDWTGSGFVLQEADSLGASWQDVQPQVTSGPYSVDLNGGSKYFRLRSN